MVLDGVIVISPVRTYICMCVRILFAISTV